MPLRWLSGGSCCPNTFCSRCFVVSAGADIKIFHSLHVKPFSTSLFTIKQTDSRLSVTQIQPSSLFSRSVLPSPPLPPPPLPHPPPVPSSPRVPPSYRIPPSLWRWTGGGWGGVQQQQQQHKPVSSSTARLFLTLSIFNVDICVAWTRLPGWFGTTEESVVSPGGSDHRKRFATR